MKGQKFIPLLVIAAGLLAYHNSFRGGFVLDDVPYIVKNPRIRQLWPPWEIMIHTSRPVVLLSVAVNYALGGLNPWGYHLFNVAVHILAALTLYAVVRRTFATEALRSDWDGAAPWLAGMVSSAWLVHPLQTESVTYVIQRGESLMGLFYLLTLYCAIRGHGPSRRFGWQVGAVTSCALGMATKPVMVTAPVVVLLYDRAFLASSWREVIEQRWRLYASLAATWGTLPLLLADGFSEWKHSAGFAFGGLSSFQYALMQPRVILHYLRLAFWPRPLCFDYGWSATQAGGNALLSLIVVGSLLVATAWAWWRKPALGFLGVWFFVILAPTSSFVPVADLAVEHRMYLPLAAVVVTTTLGGFALGRNLLSTRQEMRRMLGWVLSGTIVLLLAALTIQRNRDYRSDLALWQDTVAKCPDNPRAHYNLGVILGRAGRTREEVEQYVQALRLKPDYADAHYNLGAAAWEAGNHQEAVEHWNQALRIYPDYAQAHLHLGIAAWEAGQPQEAIVHWEQALRIDADLADAHNHLAIALMRVGRMPEAIGHYEQALRIRPDYAEAHYNLANALVQLDRVQEAIEHWERALRLKPGYAEAHNNLGTALLELGRVPEAIEHYDQALRIKPDFAEAHYSLGLALLRQSKFSEAAQHFKQALRINPELTEAQKALAKLQGIQ